MIHKPRNRELSILLTAHCLAKIHIFVKIHHHIPKGSEVMACKQYFAKDRQVNSKKIKLSFLFIPHGLDEDLSLKLNKSIPSGCRVMTRHS